MKTKRIFRNGDKVMTLPKAHSCSGVFKDFINKVCTVTDDRCQSSLGITYDGIRQFTCAEYLKPAFEIGQQLLFGFMHE